MENKSKYYFVLSMDSFLATCGNSYVNAFMEKYLEFAKDYVGYDGMINGSIRDAIIDVQDFQERYMNN